MSTPTPSRRRHLMDPNAPRPSRPTRADQQRLDSVRRWIMTALVVTTILHLQVGLIIAAYFLHDPRPGAQVGLCVIAGVFGAIAVGLARALHQRSILTPWLLLGFVPTLVGVWFLQR